LQVTVATARQTLVGTRISAAVTVRNTGSTTFHWQAGGCAIPTGSADEDVHPAGRTLGIGPGRDPRRQMQALLQLGDIDAAFFQDGASGEIQFVHGHVSDAAGHRTAQAGQEARPHPPATGGQAQVEAGRLDPVEIKRSPPKGGALG